MGIRLKKWAWSSVAVGALALGGLVLLVAADTPQKGVWQCDEFMFIHGTSAGGDKTVDEALDRLALLLTNVAPGFPGTDVELQEAVSSRTGANRYERDTGKLFIDEFLAAEAPIVMDSDGTYVVGDIKTCAPGSGAADFPTPTDSRSAD